MEQTSNYQLNQWDKTDRIQMEDFNADNAKIDAALAAEAEAREAADTALASQSCYVKLLDLTLQEDTQKWDIDMSDIDLTQYQKLVIYPRLGGNTTQWVYIHINGDATECGQVPMMNDPDRQNFGVVEYTFLHQLPNLYLIQLGITSNVSSSSVGMNGFKCPALSDGVTHLDTLNLWFNNTSYQIQAGSTIHIYGLKR